MSTLMKTERGSVGFTLHTKAHVTSTDHRCRNSDREGFTLRNMNMRHPQSSKLCELLETQFVLPNNSRQNILKSIHDSDVFRLSLILS